MLDTTEQQRIVQEVFAATGRTLPLDDPIVLAALFNASVVRKAGEQATASIREAVEDAKASLCEAMVEAEGAVRTAGKEAEKASAVALAISRQSGTLQAAFVELLDAGLHKAMHKKSYSQPTAVNRGLLPRWQLGLAALAGAVAFGLGNFAACGFSLSWVNDAATGRQFLSAIPYLDPDLKARLIADLEKRQHRR